jgi:hypothetical protein
MNFIVEALHNLKPGATWSIDGDTYDGFVWLDKTQSKPKEDEVEAEVLRLQTEYENNQYQRLRESSYPSIQDQLDILYHRGYDGWKEEINKVKEKYPKPFSKVVGIGTT